jgi:hypothetical protein
VVVCSETGSHPGCADGTEAPRNLPECTDGKDNDRDHSIDAKDPGCADGTEAPANTAPVARVGRLH